MTSNPDPVRRLNDLLNQRRTSLRLQWQEVTDRANMSTAHLRNVRTGKASLSDLAKAELEQAVLWAPGSIDSILGGGDPTPLDEPTSVTLQGTTGSILVRAGQGAIQTDDGMQAAIRELAKRLPPEDVRALLEEFAHDDPDSDNPYRDPAERHIWAMRELSEGHRRQLIIMLQAIRSTADLEASPAHQKRKTPTAEVREFRQRG